MGGCVVAELHYKGLTNEHYAHREGPDGVCVKCPGQEPIGIPADKAQLAQVRTFPSGATRDLDNDKLDPEGFLSPLVLQRFAEYMHKHRMQADGSVRESDNWQKGMPLTSYMKSGWRHFMEWWRWHRGIPLKPAKPRDPQDIEEVLCAMLFNVQAYLHELLKKEQTEMTAFIRKSA